jgi:hypothetical protein
VGVGVVALAVIAWVLLRGGDVPLIGEGPSGPTSFEFDLTGNVKVSAMSDKPPAQLGDVGQQAGDAVKQTMDELFFLAFVDQGSWGDYADVFALFDARAAARAEADTDVLTLGPAAGDEFEDVNPTSATLRISVLTDGKDAPVSAVARVEFLAEAMRTDGGTSEISSTGSFYLHPVNGTWRIFAYDVNRNDTATAAPSPTGSPS